MISHIVKDLILDIINTKIEILKARGVFTASYDELLHRLIRMGYSEDEVKAAIIKLVKNKEIKTGKFADGTGWLRDFRNIDKI